MILVDSSVWVDYFKFTPGAYRLVDASREGKSHMRGRVFRVSPLGVGFIADVA